MLWTTEQILLLWLWVHERTTRSSISFFSPKIFILLLWSVVGTLFRENFYSAVVAAVSRSGYMKKLLGPYFFTRW